MHPLRPDYQRRQSVTDVGCAAHTLPVWTTKVQIFTRIVNGQSEEDEPWGISRKFNIAVGPHLLQANICGLFKGLLVGFRGSRAIPGR